MRRYLVVDDNRDLAENLAEILRDSGAEVQVATSGQAALDQVRATRFDALVTDMRMPAMGGGELIHAVRRIDPGLPALVMTGHSGDEALAAARREGLVAVLPKPIPVDRLSTLLAVARRDGLVAVVEDDPDRADALTRALSARGFAAVTAASIIESDRLGPVAPCCALVNLRLSGEPEEAMLRLAARFPGLPMVVVAAAAVEPPLPSQELFREPCDPEAVLDAVEVIHSSRRSATP